MKLYDILSILGALAWLPTVIKLIQKQFTKPKLTIIVHKQIELGYTTNGSILNLSIALSSDNAECLVKNIEIEIEGPSRQQHILRWEWYEEKLYEFHYQDIGPTQARKQQNAIALKIPREGLIEKKVGFHETDFKEKYFNYFDATTENFINITQNGKDAEQLKLTKDFNDFKDFLKNSSIWKQGNYKGTIKVHVLNLKEPFLKDINFRLTSIDTKKIKQNIDTCELVLENYYFKKEEDDYVANWNWVYPNTIEK